MSSTHANPSTGHVALVKRTRGSAWYARVRIGGSGGQQLVKKLGPAWAERGRPPAGYFTKKTAEAELRRMITDADRGTLAATKKAGVTFSDAAAEYLRWLREDREREPSTVGDYRSVINGYLLPRFGERDVASIVAAEIETYRDELKRLVRPDGSRRLANRTILRHLMVLHAIFKRAIRVGWVDANPASAEVVDRPPVRYSGEFKTLTPDEIRLAAGQMEIATERALVLTAAFTGLRLGELLALRWRDVDFGLQRIYVRHSLTANSVKQAGGTRLRIEKAPKSGKVRSSVLVDDVIACLDGLSKRPWFSGPDDLVFCNEVGEHLSDGMLRRRWYEALDRAGLRRVRVHDLRHAFGTLAVQAFPLSDVQGYLGHAHISTTMRYVHHTPGANDAARLQAVLGESGIPNRVSNRVSNSPISGGLGAPYGT